MLLLPATPAVPVGNSAFRLSAIDPASIAPFTTKAAAKKRLKELNERLSDLQERLYAEHRRSLLLIFQATDTGGKDGAIRKLLTGLNPAGVVVTSFKAPSVEEQNHDFLWRVHAHTPGRGHIGVFNRSHYEEVLVPRVKELVEEATWRGRYADINAFEAMLARNDTHIIKFFLHISRQEQAARLQARLDDPAKRWKFSPDDLRDRQKWGDYQAAYQDLLRYCSPPGCPWWVVPANRKWARDLAIAEIVVATLENLNPQPPAATFDVAAQVIEA